MAAGVAGAPPRGGSRRLPGKVGQVIGLVVEQGATLSIVLIHLVSRVVAKDRKAFRGQTNS